MGDAPGMGQRMVGGGMCMEKFEDSPIIYENFAEAIWKGANPDPASELPAWVESYATRRYGASIPEAQEAWATIVATFYQGTGE